jgi:hypothetical protein
VAPELNQCIRKALGALDRKIELGREGEPTDAYAILAFNEPENPPTPPELKADLQLQCDAFKLSGAMDRPGGERASVAIAWIVENVRHPVSHHLAWQKAMKPFERERIDDEVLRPAGLTECHATGWSRKPRR